MEEEAKLQSKRRFLLNGFGVLISAWLLTISIKLLVIMKGFRIAKEFGYVNQFNYSRELSIVLWTSVPYVVMGTDLLCQYLLNRKRKQESFNIIPIVIASICGVVLYVFKIGSHPFVEAVGNVVIPIIQLIIYAFARLH